MNQPWKEIHIGASLHCKILTGASRYCKILCGSGVPDVGRCESVSCVRELVCKYGMPARDGAGSKVGNKNGGVNSVERVGDNTGLGSGLRMLVD